MRKFILTLCVFCFGINLLSAQDFLQKGLDAMSETEARAQMKFLASDEMQGRFTGTPFAKISAEYIASELKELGFSPEIMDFKGVSFGEEGVDYKNRKNKKEVDMRNVLATIKGKDTTRSVILGAHYDHLGLDSLGNVFNGADDNASGVVVVLQVARALKAAGETPDVNIVLAFWDGEETGLNGSKYYVEQLEDTMAVKAYVNLDMVGRNDTPDKPQRISFIYTEDDVFLTEHFSEVMEDYKFEDLAPDYRPVSDKMRGSDNAYFNQNGVPIVFWHTGAHPDYHKITDTADKLNWEKIMDLSRANYVFMWELAEYAAEIN